MSDASDLSDVTATATNKGDISVLITVPTANECKPKYRLNWQKN